jgi:nicotinate-nucleotide adenylyltransferase
MVGGGTSLRDRGYRASRCRKRTVGGIGGRRTRRSGRLQRATDSVPSGCDCDLRHHDPGPLPCTVARSGAGRRVNWQIVPVPRRVTPHPQAWRRIGVFGGTFDPPHVGHLVIAVDVRHALDLDVVLLVVANDPWQKSHLRDISPAADRLAMVQAAVGDVEGLEASDVELARGGTSYTADTLAELRVRHPEAELHLLLGSDAAAGLPTWERVDEVRAAARLVVVARPGSDDGVPPDGWTWTRVETPRLEVSSTELRARVADGRPLDYLLTPAVIECIEARGLYRHHGTTAFVTAP